MITNKAREYIKKQFDNFNSQYKSVNYPTTKMITAVKNNPDYNPNIANIPDVSKIPTSTVKTFNLQTKYTKDKVVNYSGIKKLNTELIDKKRINQDVDICVYSINNIDTKPYILFSLHNKNNVLSWPTINMKGKTVSKLQEHIKKYLECRDCIITYEGYYKYNGKTQVWFRYSYNNENIKEGKYDDTHIWALSSEIINFKKILTFPIDNLVTKFFLQNNDFIYLKNDLGRTYETPAVAYYGNYYKHIAFSATVGVLRGDTDGPLGPYYYFSNYEK